MESLLFVSQRIPYPPNKGDKIRSYNILRHLANSFRIRLATFIDDPEDWHHVPELGKLCVDAHFARLDPLRARAKCLAGLLTGQALTLPYYWDRGMAAWIAETCRREPVDVVFFYSSAVGQYLPLLPVRPRRVVVDFVDVDSDKWRQYADRQPWPKSWIYGRESRKLLDFDRRLAQSADVSLLVSEQEAALFRGLAPESASRIFGIDNGIDSEYFSPRAAWDRVVPSERPAIVFTGAMDYWPNVDAVSWFAGDILPLVRRRVDAAFYIVGSNPAPAVLDLARHEGVHVTGRVPDVRPYLAQAAAAVAPMRIARGIQNKVLEAMAMARPVVTTSQGLEGIEAVPGRHLLVADDAEAFARATSEAMLNASSMLLGQEARRLIVERFSWDARFTALDRLIGSASAAS